MPSPREVEEVFLTKLAASGDAKPAIKAGVDPTWFVDPATRRGWELQVEHIGQHDKPGTMELYNIHALGITPRFAPNDSMETLIEALRISTVIHLTRKSASRFIEEVDLSTVPFEEAHSKLLLGASSPIVSNLMGQGSEGITLEQSWDGFVKAAKTFQDAGGVVGVPYPWASLNKVTGGQCGGDYIVFGGFRKARKTDIGCIELAVENAQECGETVLVVTDELSLDDMRNRMACRWAKVQYRKFREGTFTQADWATVMAAKKEILHHPSLHMEHISSFGMSAVNEVRSLIDRHHPGVVLWDGHQLAAGSDEWKDVYQLSRRTRKLALTTNLPIIITVQLNPAKREASFKAYHQDCTVFVKVSKDGAWTHCETTEVREGDQARWSLHCERGLPLVESPFGANVAPADDHAPKETVLD